MIHIHVRLGEPFWRAVGQRELTVDLKAGARVTDLLARLCQQHPALERELAEAAPHIFIGEEEAQNDTLLTDGSWIYLVWPIAGG